VPTAHRHHLTTASRSKEARLVDSHNDLIAQIRVEFAQTPNLVLSSAQAQRLWHLSRPVWEAVLSRLIREGFLTRTRRGTFARSDSAWRAS
jgi:hypothetical protein